MSKYRESIGAGSIYALCFTHNSETVHHWSAFAGGSAGCCLEFSPDRLFSILDAYDNVSHGKVEYISMPGIGDVKPENLPFVKRRPFAPEKEYRIIATSSAQQRPAFDIDIDINVIRRITISNKIPNVVYQSIKESLMELAPEYKGKIYHSTLYNNPVWINNVRSKK